MDYGLRMMLGGGLFIWIIPFTLFLLVIYSAYKAFGPQKRNTSLGENQSPMNILKARYAKGEISEVEFQKMMDILKE